MARTIESAIPGRIRERHRRTELASDRRLGTQSRREGRARQRRWLRTQWRVILLAAALAIVMAGFVHMFVGGR
jgi:anti-sigma-K factor RskA